MFRIPKKIRVGGDIVNFFQTPKHIQLRFAIQNALRVWSNQLNTHFCDRASLFLLPFAKQAFPDAHLFKFYPKGVTFHEIILFDSDKVLDTQLKQFSFPDEYANSFIFDRASYGRTMNVELPNG